MSDLATNVLYYGANLDILRRYLPDASVDLVYLDPPFNSNRDDNVIFRDKSGNRSDAQLLAFEDTWHWVPTVGCLDGNFQADTKEVGLDRAIGIQRPRSRASRRQRQIGSLNVDSSAPGPAISQHWNARDRSSS